MRKRSATRGLEGVLEVSPATRRKLERLPVELVREFPDLPAERARRLVDGALADLLQVARFEDFVPLLAHRHARERLLDEAAAEPG